MQLETMQYFDSTMPGAVPYTLNYLEHLQWALCAEKETQKGVVKEGWLEVDDISNYNERTVYQLNFQGGEKVLSRLKKIDEQLYIENETELNGLTEITIPQDFFKIDPETGEITNGKYSFGRKKGANFYFKYGAYLSQIPVFDDVLESKIAKPFWCVFTSLKSFVFLHANSNRQGQEYMQGIYLFYEEGGTYAQGGVLRNEYDRYPFGISPNFVINAIDSSDKEYYRSISERVIGGYFSETSAPSINNVITAREMEIVPTFSYYTNKRIINLFHAPFGVNNIKESIYSFNYAGYQLHLVKGKRGEHLIFSSGGEHA